MFQDLICRWGTLYEIVMDNGKPFIKALAYLSKRYHINHIHISGYNSRANGIVEWVHFDVHQALIKAADGIKSKWFQSLYSVFWAEHITIRKCLGVSPYFIITGAQPLIPLNIIEATYLNPPLDSILSTTDLIMRWACALQKWPEDLEQIYSWVYAARQKAAQRFEHLHWKTIHDFNFQQGNLVLMCNTAIEKSLNCKMCLCYLGPLIIVSHNKGGAYIVCELNGIVFDWPIATFWLVPYHACKFIAIPDIALDISTMRLQEIEASEVTGSDDEDDTDLGEVQDDGSDTEDVD